MHDLKLHFEFLCAFVPPETFDKAPKRCWVVLPDLRSASQPHVPALLYDRDDRVSDQDLKNKSFIPKEPGVRSPKPQQTWDKLPFALEEVEIRPDGEAVPADVLDTNSNLGALLRIFHAGVGMEVFDESLLIGTGGGNVVGRLLLRQGELAIGLETKDSFGVYDASQEPPKFLHKQKMAQQVVLTLGFKKFVDLVFRQLGTTEERHLRLKPSTNPDVKVTLRNCEKERIWDEFLPSYKDQFDSEINLFFPLSKTYKNDTPPRQIVLRPYQDTHHGICAPKAFDGWGKKQGDEQ